MPELATRKVREPNETELYGIAKGNADIVNKFYITLAPGIVRLACVEGIGLGSEHNYFLRGSFAMSNDDALALAQMILDHVMPLAKKKAGE